MKAGDLLQETRFPDVRAASAGGRLPKRRWAAPRSRMRWSSRTDDGIRIEPLARARRRCRAARRAGRSAVAVDRRRSASTIPIRTAPTGRRWTTSPRARPALRWSSRARRTPSATACRPTPEALATVLRRRAAQPRPHPHRRASGKPRHGRLAGGAASASAAPIRPSSACPSASTRRRSLPAPAGCACRSRRCRRRCRNRWRISSRSGCPASCSKADGRVFHNAGATEAQELGIVLASRRLASEACSRRRARRWSTPRRISALR